MAAFLLDTNILLRSLEPGTPEHGQVARAVSALRLQGHTPAVTPQVLIEFWCAATRPVSVNGLGLDCGAVADHVREILSRFPLLPDTPQVFMTWLYLADKYAVKGKRTHDTRLVAVMLAHGVENLLTFNVDDFRSFQEIKAVHPASVT